MPATASCSYDELLQRRTQQASVLLTPNIYNWYERMQVSHDVYYDAARASWLVFRSDGECSEE